MNNIALVMPSYRKRVEEVEFVKPGLFLKNVLGTIIKGGFKAAVKKGDQAIPVNYFMVKKRMLIV